MYDQHLAGHVPSGGVISSAESDPARRKAGNFLGRGMPLQRWGRLMVVPTIVCGVVLAAATIVAMRIKMDPDITRLDGVSTRVKQAENDFQKTWGRSDKALAMLVVTGKTREAAEEANDQVYADVSPKFDEGQFVSLSGFWPSEATRLANLARWRAFWSDARIAKFRADLATAGEPFGFSADAFEPFFQSLANPSADDQSRQIVQAVEDQFTARDTANGDWQMLSYFEDTPENIARVRSLTEGRADTLIVSRGMLAQAFAESASSETRVLVGISVAFIVISLLVLTRQHQAIDDHHVSRGHRHGGDAGGAGARGPGDERRQRRGGDSGAGAGKRLWRVRRVRLGSSRTDRRTGNVFRALVVSDDFGGNWRDAAGPASGAVAGWREPDIRFAGGISYGIHHDSGN